MNALPRTVGLAVGALVCFAVVAGSQVPWVASASDEAIVRLSWRAVLPTVEDCRPPTDEDLRGIPPHMRPAEVCSGSPVPFRLEFTLDGQRLIDERVAGSGARGDRPMYVFEEFSVEPGVHRVDLTFAPDTAETARAPGTHLVRELRIGSREVVLLTRDASGRLTVR